METTTEEPQQIFDMDTDSMIANPAFKKPTENQDSDKDKDPDPDPDPAPGDKEPEPDALGEKDPDPDKDLDPNADQDPNPKKEDESITADAYVANVYGEKYGIKTESDLTTVLDNALDLQDENDTLKAELVTAKADAGKPKFSSDKQQKAFEFLQQFDVDKQGEALDTFAKLITMDVEKSDDMMILEERFIHEHPEYTRPEAQRMFTKQHGRKYNLKKEDFDSEDAYNQEVADLAIEKKGEVARAKTFLKDKQLTYKPKATEDKKPSVPEAVTKSIEKNTTDYAAHAEKTNELVFERNGEKYTFKFSAEQKEKIAKSVAVWVKNPANYDGNGQLLGIKTPSEMTKAVVGGMFMDDVISAITDQVKNSATIKRVDEINGKKPEKRTGPGSGEIPVKDDLDAQAVRIIKNNRKAS
jgi:hypothetical protein